MKAIRFNGIGTAWLGINRMDDRGICVATRWFTFLWAPLIPLNRALVQFVKRGKSSSYRVINELPIERGEALRTFVMSWGRLLLVTWPWVLFLVSPGSTKVFTDMGEAAFFGLFVGWPMAGVWLFSSLSDRAKDPGKAGKAENRQFVESVLSASVIDKPK